MSTNKITKTTIKRIYLLTDDEMAKVASLIKLGASTMPIDSTFRGDAMKLSNHLLAERLEAEEVQVIEELE